MKRPRTVTVVMTEEAWELFDSYADFMRKKTRSRGPVLSGVLVGAIVEFFLLAMKEDILKGREEVSLAAFSRKLSHVKTVIHRRGLSLPKQLLAQDTQGRRSPTQDADPPGAGRDAPTERREVKIPWPV